MSSTSSEYVAGGEELVLETFGESVETFDGDFAQTLALLEMDADEVHNAINESVEEVSKK